MHIGIEAHGFWGEAEGQAVYIARLIRALGRLDRSNQYTLFFNSLTSTAERRARVEKELPPNFRAVFLPLPNVSHHAVLFLKERVVWPLVARRLGIDVFHSTSYRAIFAKGMRTVLSVHDFSHHYYPETFLPGTLRYYSRLPHDAARAAFVLTLSDSSSRDAVRLLGVPRERVRTVYAGVDTDCFKPPASRQDVEATRLQYGIRSPAVLFTGSLNPKKNVDTLIAALGRLRAQGHDRYQLVLAGKTTTHQPALEAAIARWGLTSQVIYTGFLQHGELSHLYHAVDLFVFPSLFEGFGFPVIEAMACGTPVVASNVSSIPEVAGDAAILIDPLNPEALAAAIRRVTEDEALRQSMIARGFSRAQQFSWEQAARRVLAVYREAYAAAPGTP